METDIDLLRQLLDEFNVEIFNSNYNTIYQILLFNLINPEGVFFLYIERKFQEENTLNEEIYDFAQKVKFLNRNAKISPVIGIIISMRNKLIHNIPITYEKVSQFLHKLTELMINDSGEEINQLTIVISEILGEDIPRRTLRRKEKILLSNLISYINHDNVEVPIDFIQTCEKLYHNLVVDSDSREGWNLFEWHNYGKVNELLNNIIEIRLHNSNTKAIIVSYNKLNMRISLKNEYLNIDMFTRFNVLRDYVTTFTEWRNELNENFLIDRYVMLNPESPINDIVIFKKWEDNTIKVLHDGKIITLNIHTLFGYIPKDLAKTEKISFEDWERRYDVNLLINRRMLINNESLVHTFLEWTEHNVILSRANRKRILSRDTMFRLL